MKCEKCGQNIKQEKPVLFVGQKLFACIGWEGNIIRHYEVADGTNRKSLRIKCFDDDGSPWFSTGFGYKHIGTRLFLTENDAKKNILHD